LSPAPEVSGFLIEEVGGIKNCRNATPEEALALSESNEQLHPITPGRHGGTGGLSITLRGTQQLENSPQAKAAFLAAAARWESLIQTPISIVIDVDFGPNFFGHPFPPPVLGATGTQSLIGSRIYDYVRDGLAAGASSVPEARLYDLLPVGSIGTDIGHTTTMLSTSADFRALGLISPIADPVGEMPFFGPPPRIGFNSSFPFDFDPGDGIDVDKFDFDAVAAHEIGHVLGFESNVGIKEIAPFFPTAPSVLDLFRFRGDVTLAMFGFADRILSSGGEQVFFDGHQQLELSTGRPDGSGGDGAQASHWKQLVVNPHQPPIGIMIPGIGPGERHVITRNDLEALDAIGYR